MCSDQGCHIMSSVNTFCTGYRAYRCDAGRFHVVSIVFSPYRSICYGHNLVYKHIHAYAGLRIDLDLLQYPNVIPIPMLNILISFL